MARSTVEAQLAALRKQRELLNKKEQLLLGKSHEKVLARILQIAKDAGLTPAAIAKAFAEIKPGKTAKTAKPANPLQTWTGRGVTPSWVQALKSSGTLESAFIGSTPAAA